MPLSEISFEYLRRRMSPMDSDGVLNGLKTNLLCPDCGEQLYYNYTGNSRFYCPNCTHEFNWKDVKIPNPYKISYFGIAEVIMNEFKDDLESSVKEVQESLKDKIIPCEWISSENGKSPYTLTMTFTPNVPQQNQVVKCVLPMIGYV